ncbi:uncharacterized protein AALT_g8206 [Alternaria alternata]|nr:uncharacterized protein AALT_g8206 [Alternaria alternata]
MNPPPRLACQQCKSRKIKCDKGAPCSACRNSGLSCHAVQRARLPRGKTAKGLASNRDLAARVARIEILLEQQSKQTVSQGIASDQVSIPGNLRNDGLVGVASEKIADFVAPDFWNALSSEVHGLREALEDNAEDEANTHDVEVTGKAAGDTCSTNAILFPQWSKSYANPYDDLSPDVGLRTCCSGAYTWTLVAVAVRAATLLRLGEEDPKDFSPFDIQLRQRLFFAIGILDTHSALDRGTIPILPSTSFRAPPLNINDDDMHPTDKVLQPSLQYPTDMSHTAMIYEAMICQRRLYEISDGVQNGWEQWTKKVELLNEFKTSILSERTNVHSYDSPLEMLRRMSAQKIIVSMQLLARRPPYRQPHNTVPPWDDFDIMKSATEVLEQHLQPIPVELQPWAWKNWVQWHALAVLLAELMVRPQEPSSDRSYTIATQSFRHYARLVADSESGLLWKPIAKLMRRVQRLRQTPDTAGNKNLAIGTETVFTVPIVTEQTCSSTSNNDLFDLSNWGMNEDDLNVPFLGLEDHVRPQYNDNEDGNETPWLAWDNFVRDINFSPP